ncbi:winged helix DNA-binding protein [Paracoccus sp. p4-l81]|uniref:winged helix DNA-binding protein n=1 Tax=unclassified Paracoccus (in: a-proteobacteria) TaxID=2688777 RepID=UPI0035B7AC61
MTDEQQRANVGPVVLAAHLAKSSLPALSEVEFAQTMCVNAFTRWMVNCAAAAGMPGMTPLEVQVLHLVQHRDRPKTQAQICLLLNIEDTHLVSYALKKLAAQGLVTAGRRGKEKTVMTTPEGAQICTRYAEVREALLLSNARDIGFSPADLSELARLMRALSGAYDQAARAAASL